LKQEQWIKQIQLIQRVFWELSERLPENCILTGDSGSTASWLARDIKIHDGMMFSLSGTLATMCSAVPYAIAAKFAYPHRMAVAIAGDGAMQMQGINELITIAKYWREWLSPKLLVVVINNRDLNMVSWEQRALGGNPKFEDSQNVPDFPYAEYAKLIGLDGIRVENPDDIDNALDKAMLADKPFVLEVVTDPTVPMLPPHITMKQRKEFVTSLLKGDPEAGRIIKQVYSQLTEKYNVE
jgi:pyruvate dehydrogenase (quinone)